MLQDTPQDSGSKFGSRDCEAADKKPLAILCRYHLPAAAFLLKNRFNLRFAVNPLELRGKLASDLLIRNLNATLDDDLGSVAMPV
ncbi:hypothetical protein GOA99_27715 [Sinorhizobium meliloti]|nr:hypothetical protein [Sinorhizobium meliloti]MDW9364347.1 hypothetical protein [Sinorhizobium meliloti]MDW9388381.1 hypothetical protein [Sinorhizobium meliloti]MDW9602584.1 hypothetical protein [Sinorhizobium meliloti]MQV06001.1 hypothetical protein [Sinorhizobium meliloti]